MLESASAPIGSLSQSRPSGTPRAMTPWRCCTSFGPTGSATVEPARCFQKSVARSVRVWALGEQVVPMHRLSTMGPWASFCSRSAAEVAMWLWYSSAAPLRVSTASRPEQAIGGSALRVLLAEESSGGDWVPCVSAHAPRVSERVSTRLLLLGLRY